MSSKTSNQEEFDNLEELIDSANNPISFLKNSGKEGLKTIKKMVFAIFLFVATNTFLGFYAIYRIITSSFEGSRLLFFFITIGLCVGFVLFAVSKSYSFAIVDAIRIGYNKVNFLLKKACVLIVDKAEVAFTAMGNASNKDLSKAINVYDISKKIFDKVPTFISKRIIAIITDKVPIIDLVSGLKNDIVGGNKEEASDKLFVQIDGKIKSTVFEENNIKWIFWLLPLNFILVVALIIFKVA